MNQIIVYETNENDYEIHYYFLSTKGDSPAGNKLGEVERTILDTLKNNEIFGRTLFLSSYNLQSQGKNAVSRKFLKKLRKNLEKRVDMEIVMLSS